MNGHTALPALTFSEDCCYDTLDCLLNGNPQWRFKGFGLAVRIWFKQGAVIAAMWGSTGSYVEDDGQDRTTLLAWSAKDDDYTNPIRVVTDDIVKVQVL